MVWMLAAALAADPPPTGAALLARWQQPGSQVILLTPERLAAFGPSYEPNEAATHADFVIELSLDPAPFCPRIPPFDLWTKVGFFAWSPYLHGCGGPTELTAISAEGDHVDIVGDVAIPYEGEGVPRPVRVRVTPRGGGDYSVSWRRETDSDSPWSPSILMVEGRESTLRRLIRFRYEAAGPILEKAGIVADAKQIRLDDADVTIDRSKCIVGQWACDPAQIAVTCPAGGSSSVLVLDGVVSLRENLYAWEACTRGVLPGIR